MQLSCMAFTIWVYSQRHLLEPRCYLHICSAKVKPFSLGIGLLLVHVPKALLCAISSSAICPQCILLSPPKFCSIFAVKSPVWSYPTLSCLFFSSWLPVTGNSHMKEDCEETVISACCLWLVPFFQFLPQLLAAQSQLSAESNLYLPPAHWLKVPSKLLLSIQQGIQLQLITLF